MEVFLRRIGETEKLAGYGLAELYVRFYYIVPSKVSIISGLIR